MNRTHDEARQIFDLVRDYVKKHGVVSTKGMQDHLKGLGYGVSTGTIAEYYRQMGYKPVRQPSFVWNRDIERKAK